MPTQIDNKPSVCTEEKYGRGWIPHHPSRHIQILTDQNWNRLIVWIRSLTVLVLLTRTLSRMCVVLCCLMASRLLRVIPLSDGQGSFIFCSVHLGLLCGRLKTSSLHFHPIRPTSIKKKNNGIERMPLQNKSY